MREPEPSKEQPTININPSSIVFKMEKICIFGILFLINLHCVNGGWAVVNGDRDKTLEELEAEGIWTGWMDGDSGEGTGDFETVSYWRTDYNSDFAGTCKMWCEDPLAVQWKVIPNTDYVDTLQKIESCTVLYPEKFYKLKNGQTNRMKGFYCMNTYQKHTTCGEDYCLKNGLSTQTVKRGMYFYKCDKCPNFQVNYLCPSTVEKPIGDCPKDVARELSSIDKAVEMNRRTLGAMEELQARGLEQQSQVRNEKKPVEAPQDDEYRELAKLLQYLNID